MVLFCHFRRASHPYELCKKFNGSNLLNNFNTFITKYVPSKNVVIESLVFEMGDTILGRVAKK